MDKKPKKFLEFILLEEKEKTNVYSVYHKEKQISLGIIFWYGAWRRYVHKPDDDTIWDSACYKEVSAFLDKLMDERNEIRKKIAIKKTQ